MATFAIIGYGSLIWDLDNLAPYVEGEWDMYQGPHLPLEFSLISKKRKRALALAIDHVDGLPCPTCVITSRRHLLEHAVIDLARRERAAKHQIGFFDRVSGTGHSRSSTTLRTMQDWLNRSTFDGVVWTDGESNFESLTGHAFSLQVALDHLRELTGESLTEARRYIHNTPQRVDTPLRRALANSHWWHHAADD